MDCMNLYMSVLEGSGCSQSFRGTERESMMAELMGEMEAIANVKTQVQRREREYKKRSYTYSPMSSCKSSVRLCHRPRSPAP